MLLAFVDAPLAAGGGRGGSRMLVDAPCTIHNARISQLAALASSSRYLLPILDNGRWPIDSPPRWRPMAPNDASSSW